MVATMVPTLSDEFQSLKEVGWYGSVYLLVTGATQPMFGKLYATFSTKAIFLSSLLLLEGGSLICALARNSGSFIAGRTIAGLGSAGCISGALTITAVVVPLQQRPIFTGVLGSLEGVAVVLGPIVGGAITSHIGWRWCFWINLPIGGALFTVLLLLFKPPRAPGQRAPLKDRIKQVDFIGGMGLVGSITCLLLALEWGSTQYSWSDARLVGLLVVFGVSFVSVAVHQHWLKEKATFPTRLLKNKSFASCLWYGFTLSSAQMVVLYYLPLWFQAIQGVPANESGVRLLPMVLALILSGVLAGIGASLIGYLPPFMMAGTVFASTGAGMLYTFHPEIETAKWIGYQILFGLGTGTGVQQSIVGVQAALDPSDVPYGTSAIILVNTVGGSIFISVAQNVFITRIERLTQLIPNVDRSTPLDRFRSLGESLTPEQLAVALREYSRGIKSIFLIAVILACLSTFGWFFIKWILLKPSKQVPSSNEENSSNEGAKTTDVIPQPTLQRISSRTEESIIYLFGSFPGVHPTSGDTGGAMPRARKGCACPGTICDLLETDYNTHKSTARAYLILMWREGNFLPLRAKVSRGGQYKKYKDGVQVLPAAFDMHSRILAWDQKYIYTTTYSSEKQKMLANGKGPSRSRPNHATALSVCVVEAGRFVVPPEKFFHAAAMLQPALPDMSRVGSNTSESLGRSKKDKN
ncbi:major facilitator superfamily transporter [Colletotrichum incanum]|uniref:Major facilitator superfamily transporter n=1 Tax=Colletotrichum incanum TaxID=1573173 RepID=A0A167CLH1_COLIC|nr:major facilitator superfamily transporter [Colletotrichum incanum]